MLPTGLLRDINTVLNYELVYNCNYIISVYLSPFLISLCPELQDLISNGVFGPDGAVNPFSHECVQFMLRSLSITATRIFSSENGCQRIASGGKLTLQSDNYIQLCLVAKGGFASVYSALDSSGTKKALKVL